MTSLDLTVSVRKLEMEALHGYSILVYIRIYLGLMLLYGQIWGNHLYSEV
jgi:hypothetical protein